MIVTIDGPAGVGKSSTARILAERLGFEFLNTGAMYRAVALAALRQQIALDDHEGLRQLLDTLQLRLEGNQIFLNDEDVSSAIHTPEVSAGSSKVAASPVVRLYLVALQRQIAAGRNMVCEGRDQGTVVFPDALCKFFLDADPEERLRRRVRQLQEGGEFVDLEQLRQIQAQRDERDASRALAPLRPAADAVIVDSTHATLDEVVQRMETEVRRRLTQVEGTSA
jgi:cytidylate kinase